MICYTLDSVPGRGNLIYISLNPSLHTLPTSMTALYLLLSCVTPFATTNAISYLLSHIRRKVEKRMCNCYWPTILCLCHKFLLDKRYFIYILIWIINYFLLLMNKFLYIYKKVVTFYILILTSKHISFHLSLSNFSRSVKRTAQNFV